MNYKRFKSENDVDLISFPKFNWEVIETSYGEEFYNMSVGDSFFHNIDATLELEKNILSITRGNEDTTQTINIKIDNIEDAENIVEKIANGEELEIPPLYLK